MSEATCYECLVEQVNFARGIHAHKEARNRFLNNVTSYHAQCRASNGTLQESLKAGNKLEELNEYTVELVNSLLTEGRRCTTLVDLVIAGTVEFRHLFDINSARAIQSVIDTIGANALTAVRGATDDDPADGIHIDSFSDSSLASSW